MKRIKIIVFSLLLAVCWFSLSYSAFAVSLESNQSISPENFVKMVNQDQSMKNKIAQVEGGLMFAPEGSRADLWEDNVRTRIDEGPWEGMNYPALKALSPPPIATVRYWPCNESGRYVFAKNIDTTKSYYVTIRHFAKNLKEPNSPDFTGDTSYTMEPESRFGLGCTISLGYDGQPSYLHKWEVIDYWEAP